MLKQIDYEKMIRQASPKQTGRRLRNLRVMHGLKSGNMARQMNLLPATYSNYETGISRPSIENAVRIVTFYKVTLDYLYMGSFFGISDKLTRRIKSFENIIL